MDQMNHIFKKDITHAGQQVDKQNNKEGVAINLNLNVKGKVAMVGMGDTDKKIDQELLKKQMEEIQNQLRQFEELMADDGDKHKGNNEKNKKQKNSTNKKQ